MTASSSSRYIHQLLILCLFFFSTPAFAAPCESLSILKLPDTTIVSAQSVPAGGLTEPTSPAFKDLSAFCRVIMRIKPAADSDIKVEVWMPLSGWNGRLQGTGNGGFGGSLAYSDMAFALRSGDAAAGTDTGHTGTPPDATWALKHQEKIIDFGHRAIHEMTVKAKAVVAAFYGEGAKHSYFVGCSNGGRQALMEAQRYPSDYDGILAGAPANYWTHLLTAAVWNIQATEAKPASYIPAAKIPALSAAVLAACDGQDGLKDGLVNDPRACHFDPAVLLCHKEAGADSNSCFTAPQVAALKKIYAGPHDSKGRRIFSGFSPGGEEGGGGWGLWLSGSAPGTSLQFLFGAGFYKNMVFDDPAWDFKTFNFDTGVKLADDKQARVLNATDPNVKDFAKHGGKLILYHGWSDIAIPPLNTIAYYNSVVRAMGAQSTASFARLYMAPGMQHCGGGPGPNVFGQWTDTRDSDVQYGALATLEQWVEKGTAPDKIIATKYVVDQTRASGVKMTRPLCPFPQVAKYKGAGDTNDAANFVCAAAKK
ncbi:MAG: tannase/feruloyl esterase family alpha/beta hydrolase [Acidobacteriia bacterium]|nr:tannase/feruloyl esterase family alpha/beta hydrolase [Terriglobia bacterium]